MEAIEGGLDDVLTGVWGGQVLPLPVLTHEDFDTGKKVFVAPRQKNGGLVFLPTSHALGRGHGTPGDYDTKQLTPNLQGMQLPEHMEAVKNTILGAYGDVPPMVVRPQC